MTSTRLPRAPVALLTALLLAASGSAAAQEAAEPDPVGPPPAAAENPGAADDATAEETAKDERHAFWTVHFLGGLLVPLGDMDETHAKGLATAMHIGWTGKRGLGADLSFQYAPLVGEETPDIDTIETHFLAASFLPKVTLGRDLIRFWIAAGGGIAFERTTTTFRGDGRDDEKTGGVSAQARGVAGLELHFIGSGGLVFTGSYNRTTGHTDAEYVDVTGGLVFTF